MATFDTGVVCVKLMMQMYCSTLDQTIATNRVMKTLRTLRDYEFIRVNDVHWRTLLGQNRNFEESKNQFIAEFSLYTSL